MLLALYPRLARCTASRMHRTLHSSSIRRNGLTNMLADSSAPAVQVKSITSAGDIELASGLLLSGACILLWGKVFLWDVPQSKLWEAWGKEHFEIFDVVVPKPEILLLGTGRRTAQLPPTLRAYLRQIGIQTDVMDTRSACSTYNLLAEEGRNVAAALLPLSPTPWQQVPSS